MEQRKLGGKLKAVESHSTRAQRIRGVEVLYGLLNP